MVADALAPHLDHRNRAILSGPAAQLSPEQVVGVSLANYELATNASKYGALSNESGRIRIDWDTSGVGRFTFLWRERGGSVVAEPSQTGFGSRLTNKIVASYFDGKAETEYAPEGVTFRLSGSLHAQSAAEQRAPVSDRRAGIQHFRWIAEMIFRKAVYVSSVWLLSLALAANCSMLGM